MLSIQYQREIEHDHFDLFDWVWFAYAGFVGFCLAILVGCTAPVTAPKKVTALPQIAMAAEASLPTTVAIGYRTTNGRPLSDIGFSVTYAGPLPQLSLVIAPNAISLVHTVNGLAIPVITAPWSGAQMMPPGFFGLITNGVAMAQPNTTFSQPPQPPASSLRLRVPPLKYPAKTPARWALQESEDLVHWRTIARYYDSGYAMESFVAPASGTKFFRRIGNPWPPEGLYKHLPGTNDNQ